MNVSRWLCARWSACILVAGRLSLAPAIHPGQEVVKRDLGEVFPRADQVIADYPDDVQRSAALEILGVAMGLLKTEPASPTTSQRYASYFSTQNSIISEYLQEGQPSAAYLEYQASYIRLESDPQFQGAVLARYHLDGYPGLKDQLTRVPSLHKVPDKTAPRVLGRKPTWLQRHLPHLRLSGWALHALTFAAVVLLTPLFVVILASSRAGSSTSGLANPEPLQLPPPLRTIAVPWKRYPAGIIFGLVLDKETSVDLNVTTRTTGGGGYSDRGGTYHQPVSTATTVTSVQKDLMWVRTLDGQETPWTFTGGQFNARAGHVISRLGGNEESLAAYNHSTGQLVPFTGAINRANRTPLLLAWVASVATGTLLFQGVAARLAPLVHNQLAIEDLLVGGASWVTGPIISAFLGLIAVVVTEVIVRTVRKGSFFRSYLPPYLDFVRRATPEATQRFAART